MRAAQFANPRSEHDQELDSLLVGPIPVGVNKFAFEAEPPKLNRIPDSEIMGVTVILLTGSYDGREFVRVGYYVNNEYTDEALINEPPAKPIIDKITRNILAEKPRVTRLNIKWYVVIAISFRCKDIASHCYHGGLDPPYDQSIHPSCQTFFSDPLFLFFCNRDSEETAPAEFPPDQPGVDGEEADGDKYGLDEEDDEDDEEEDDETAAAAGDGTASGSKEKIDTDGDVEMGDGDADGDADGEAGDAETEASGVDDGAESEDIEADTEEEDDYDDEDDDGAEDVLVGEHGDEAAIPSLGSSGNGGNGNGASTSMTGSSAAAAVPSQ